MARTSEQLTPAELLAVGELNTVANSKIYYKNSSGVITGLGVGTNLSIGSGNLNATGGGGSSLWTTLAGTRASNTTFTFTGDITTYINSGMIIRWEESGSVKCGYITSATYSDPTTTVNIIGDTMASIDTGTLQYTFVIPVIEKFAVAGTIGATGENIANKKTIFNSYRLLACLLSVGTAGTTNNTTVDINKNGTTAFTTKPTLATTVASSVTTADSGTSLVAMDYLTVDIDAIQTTPAVDLYVDVVLFPTILLNLE